MPAGTGSPPPAKGAPNKGASAASTPTTRTAARSNGGPASKNDRESTDSTINSVAQARAYLAEKKLLPADEPTEYRILSHILFTLAATKATSSGVTTRGTLTKDLTDGLRAVAYCLEDHALKAPCNEIQRATQELATLTEHTKEQFAALEQKLTAASLSARADLELTSAMIKTSAQKALDDIQNAAAAAASHMQNNATPAQAAGGQPQPNPQPPAPVTYASALTRNSHVPADHATAVARQDAKRRQVIITKAPGASIETLRDLKEPEILAKARFALEEAQTSLGLDGQQRLQSRFVSARKLRSEDIALDCNSEEIVQWMDDADHKKAFLDFFGPNVLLGKKLLQIKVDWVPVSYVPGTAEAAREIETNNNLPTGSIENVRWMKPTRRRQTGQKTATICINLRDPNVANRLIRDDIAIGGVRRKAKRLQVYPTRCLKCQEYGHIADACRAEASICSTCGSTEHGSPDCTIANTDSASHYCVPCKSKGHASYASDCPTLRRKRERHDNAFPENRYLYFPTGEPYTWAIAGEVRPDQPPSAPPRTVPPQPPSQRASQQQSGQHQALQSSEAAFHRINFREGNLTQRQRRDTNATKSNNIPIVGTNRFSQNAEASSSGSATVERGRGASSLPERPPNARASSSTGQRASTPKPSKERATSARSRTRYPYQSNKLSNYIQSPHASQPSSPLTATVPLPNPTSATSSSSPTDPPQPSSSSSTSPPITTAPATQPSILPPPPPNASINQVDLYSRLHPPSPITATQSPSGVIHYSHDPRTFPPPETAPADTQSNDSPNTSLSS